MNIALQMEREDFATIFCRTLEHFLLWRDGSDYRVTWDSPAVRGAATLYVHPRLGIATPKWTDPRRFAFVWRELRSGKSTLESVARRLYLAAHLAPGPIRSVLAAHTVTIEPAPPRFNDGFYVPGGNQIRWFEPAAGRCSVCVKSGFPDHYFHAQTSVRSNYEVPAPRLIDVDQGALVFSEEISTGRARPGASDRERGRLKARALAALEPLANASRQQTTTRAYASSLAQDIVANSAALGGALRNRVAGFARTLMQQVVDQQLETVIAHGDLTFGHILDDGDRVVLVDWEHSARRQRRHDELTLELRPQLPQLFFDRIGAGPHDVEVVLLLLEGLELVTRESNNSALNGPPTSLLAVLQGLETTVGASGMVAKP